MGGSDEDESSFLGSGRPMEESNVTVELVKIRERMAAQRKDIEEHVVDVKRLWDFAGKLEDRIRALEVKVAVIAAVSACGGGVVGGFLSKLFQ